MEWLAENGLKLAAYGLGGLFILWLFVAIFGTPFGKWKKNLK